jgi:hypothetical protein
VAKETVVQRDFQLGVALPEIIDGDDLEMRGQSLRNGQNVRTTAGRTARQRMGTWQKLVLEGGEEFFEMRPPNQPSFGLIVSNNGLKVIDAEYSEVAFFSDVPWNDASEVWFASFGAVAILGPKIYAIELKDDIWAFGQMAFAERAGGGLAMPFWSFEKNVNLTPSGYTGAISVTADSPIFQPQWVGNRIRYADSEIEITRYVSATVIEGTVTEELPPTYRITIGDTSGFAVGEIIVASEGNWRGILVAKTSTIIYCVTLSGNAGSVAGSTTDFGGPSTTEDVVSSRSSKSPSAVVKETNPLGTYIWDEQLFSDLRGWPNSGTAVDGRLTLCDFPLIPDLIAISSARGYTDFGVGLADDDAIVRQAGNDTPRFLHVIAAVDLILLSDRGCYFVKTRDGQLLTPSTFKAVQFDQRGASPIRPALVDAGVVFAERGRNAISACLLSGNVYLNWTIIELSRYHHHLFSNPISICGPVQANDVGEKYLLIVQDTGSLVAMSWNAELGQEKVGFIPWVTQGRFQRAFQLFDAYHCTALRGVSGFETATMERFDPTSYLDAALESPTLMNAGPMTDHNGDNITTESGAEIKITNTAFAHIKGLEVVVFKDNEVVASTTLNNSGEWETEPGITGIFQAGLKFRPSVSPWPVEIVKSPRLGMIKVRVIRVAVNVLNTVSFSVLRNSTTSTVSKRQPGDAADAPPPLKTDMYRFNVFGNRAHPEIEIFSDDPGPFEVTAITQEVQL